MPFRKLYTNAMQELYPNSGTLSQIRSLVPIKEIVQIKRIVQIKGIVSIKEPYPNSGALSKPSNLVPIKEHCQNPAILSQLRSLRYPNSENCQINKHYSNPWTLIESRNIDRIPEPWHNQETLALYTRNVPI